MNAKNSLELKFKHTSAVCALNIIIQNIQMARISKNKF